MTAGMRGRLAAVRQRATDSRGMALTEMIVVLAIIAILASIAFHTRVRLEEVAHVGIDRSDRADIAYAAELGYAVKLIASARRIDGGVVARVHPSLLHRDHPLASVEGASNAVMLRE